MKKNTKRALTLLLALALCLGLLPMAALAEEDDGEFTITLDAAPGKFADGSATKTIQTHSGEDESTKHMIDYPRDEPVRDGYYFKSWYLNDPTENPGVWNMNFTGNATLKAYWVPNSNEYVLKLDPNGGSCPVESVKLSVENHTAPTLEEALPTPTREGYTFEGWFVGDREVKAGFASSGNETAVAKWSKAGAQDPARVDFIPNGGKITSIRGIPAKDILAGSMKAQENNVFVDRNSGIGMMMTGGDGRLDSFPEIEREGCTFDGWYAVGSSVLTNAYAGKEVDIPSGAKRADLSTAFKDGALLAAKWTQKAANPNGPFTVKFDLNYKDPPKAEIPKDQTIQKGSTVALPDGSKLTCPFLTHEFYAWCVKGEGGKLYPWKESAGVTADMTLYAGWVKKGTAVKEGEAVPDTSGQGAQQQPAQPSTPAAPKFTDVPAASPFAPAISWAVEKGITKGKTGTTFAPGEPCTRAQIVTFLWRAAGSPEPKTMEAEYADVTNTAAYYYKAIQWAAEMGMEESGTFKPGEPCTRGQAMYFIWKARAGASSAGSAPHFTDLSRDSLYYDAVLWAVGQGVTNGTGDGTTFSPANPCTRGQIVTFLYRAYEK